MSVPAAGLRLGLWLDRLDQSLVRFMSVYGIHLLRLAIAIVYLWFGALKLINASPAGSWWCEPCSGSRHP